MAGTIPTMLGEASMAGAAGMAAAGMAAATAGDTIITGVAVVITGDGVATDTTQATIIPTVCQEDRATELPVRRTTQAIVSVHVPVTPAILTAALTTV